jgi:hypothetical protein
MWLGKVRPGGTKVVVPEVLTNDRTALPSGPSVTVSERTEAFDGHLVILQFGEALRSLHSANVR